MDRGCCCHGYERPAELGVRTRTFIAVYRFWLAIVFSAENMGGSPWVSFPKYVLMVYDSGSKTSKHESMIDRLVNQLSNQLMKQHRWANHNQAALQRKHLSLEQTVAPRRFLF